MELEATITSVRTGPLIWMNKPVTCRDCGANDRWNLVIGQPVGPASELTWMVCSADHRVQHPLVYPALVRRLKEWADGPAEAKLDLRDWYPHWPTQPDEQEQAVVYRHWDDYSPPGWDTDWPEIAAGRRTLDALTVWLKETQDTDMSLVWMCSWGPNDPDRRTIERAA